MQKNVPKYTPDWVPTVPFWAETSKREVSYALCNDRRTLLWFAQPAGDRVPPGARAGRAARSHDPPHPRPRPARGRVVPQGGAGGSARAPGARRRRPRRRGEDQRRQGRCTCSSRSTTRRRSRRWPPPPGPSPCAPPPSIPTIATTEFVKDDRGGQVFVDSTRVGGGTVVAAYSPRVRPGVPVSFPVGWDDLDADHAARLHRAHRARAPRRPRPVGRADARAPGDPARSWSRRAARSPSAGWPPCTRASAASEPRARATLTLGSEPRAAAAVDRRA